MTTHPTESDESTKDVAKEETRRALDKATRRMELARAQETELEAWTVLGSQLLQSPPGTLPDNTVEGVEAINEALQQGLSSLPPPHDNVGGQWAQAVHRSVQAFCIEKMTQQTQFLEKERSEHAKALSKSHKVLQKHKDPKMWLELLDERLESLKSHHARYATVQAASISNVSSHIQSHLQDLGNEERFSTEESLGKYLDLQDQFQQARHDGLVAKDCDYIDFLQGLEKGSWTQWNKDKRKYQKLVTKLQTYLESFLRRVSPLLDAKKLINGDWEKPKSLSLDLTKFETVEDIAKGVDHETAKKELLQLGIKSGGTPLDRAKRLLQIRNANSLDDLPTKLWAKRRGVDPEAAIRALLNQLQPILQATVRRSERRQSQSLAEREREVVEEIYGTGEPSSKKAKTGSDDEDDAPIYNPKNVPLDWDGKPIPYWLFKLHGLNHYYPCEICGGESYRGRRNFEVHFTEQRHATGMKNLGIPNTKHFHGVTAIEDAMTLWEKLRVQVGRQDFDDAREEEYEDSHGNVLTRTTYEELARQGRL